MTKTSPVLMAMVSLCFSACAVKPAQNLDFISKNPYGPPAMSSHGRLPASSDLDYEKVTTDLGIVVFVSQKDRCEDQPLARSLTKQEIADGVSKIKLILPKFAQIISNIQKVDPERARIVQEHLSKLAILMDGADSVHCGGVAQNIHFQGRSRPAIFLSLRGASVKSMQTVLPHEYTHLVMRALNLGGGLLDEAFADLLALSVNNFRPYFAEGDGERTLQAIEENRKKKETSDAMKESYTYGCATKQAQRDFTLPRALEGAYRGLAIHNVSCDFVFQFLSHKSSLQEKSNALYRYLFGWDQNLPRPAKVMSANLAGVLNDLFQEKLLTEPQPVAGVQAKAEVKQLQDEVFVDVSLDRALEKRIIQNVVKPVSLEIQDEKNITAIQWIKYLSQYEPKLQGKPMVSCGISNRTDCFCFSGKPVKVVGYFLEQQTQKAARLDIDSALSFPQGCFSFLQVAP